MKAYELIVGRTKDTFLYPITENVYQNLQDIMGGIVIGDHEIIELMDILVCLTEVKGVAMVVFDHAAEPDAEWEFSIYTGDEGSDERELVIVTAADFDENTIDGKVLVIVIPLPCFWQRYVNRKESKIRKSPTAGGRGAGFRLGGVSKK